MKKFNIKNPRHNILTRRGYIIDKKKVTDSDIINIKKELSITPKVMDFGEDIVPIELYKETKKYICVPRFYAKKKFGSPNKIISLSGKKVNFIFKGEPRKEQKIIIDKTISILKKDGGGILQLYCGFGKTVLAIIIASILKLKTLVIVNKTSLQNQWYDRIKTFTNAKVGIIRRNKIDTDNKDIVIGMLNSISMRDYDLSIFDDFGFVVCDECFVYDTKIQTSKGFKKIGKIYDEFNNNINNTVISYNEKNILFEYKKVIYVSKNKRKIIKLCIGDTIIRCTPEHKFLTIDGYKPIYSISLNTPIISNKSKKTYRMATEDGIQIFYALYILNKHIEIKNYKLGLLFRICKKNKKFYGNSVNEKYILWLLKTFGYKIYNNCTEWIYIDKKINDRINILKYIDIRGISVLFHNNIIDYNYNNINKKNKPSIIYLYKFTNNEIKIIIKKLKLYNIYCSINYDIQGTRYIEIDNKIEATYKLSKYFPNYQMYIFENTININKINKYKWNTLHKFYISFIDYYINTENIKNVYDIEVKDNNNFVLKSGCVVHNCHHFASRVFSKALFKVGTKFMLGLSATPKRKDGLTKVINWYIGDIIYKLEREGDKRIIVKFINSYYNDKLYVEHKRYIKNLGIKPIVPLMINSLVKVNKRNNFIVKCIWKIINNDDRKILVLSDRIEHLEKLKNKLDTKIKKFEEKEELDEDEITTGLYIGRMKRYELEDSEKKDVIFASFAIASEGLDIPDLNTLFLATPKSDVIQCVGRILRKQLKNGDQNPIIFDICDQYSVFKKHGDKRINYYKKKDYTVDNYNCVDGNILSKIDYYKETTDNNFVELFRDVMEKGKDDYTPSINDICGKSLI